MRQIKGIILLTIVLTAVWLLLTGSFAAEELIVGGFVLALSLILFRRYYELFGGLRFSLKALALLPAYLILFVWELIKSNIDVASRVLRPSLPINPGIVKVKTDLKSDVGKLVLANSITLTPGTLTIDVDDDFLYIHWIDVKDSSPEAAQTRISRRFEGLLKEIVE
ncbi:MAG TPA: Na+/H+ antiporter subunit D [Sediminispirochaeta sp.]|nr:Na+/H+ antiporter subunit D [Sediminispirochaeta sp.]